MEVGPQGPDLSVGDFLKSDARFVWVEVAGVRLYSCYFSPGDPFEVFETQILLLEESLSENVRRSLIGGDLNSKPPEWGEARLDRRGILSDHRCIEFNLEQRRKTVDKGRNEPLLEHETALQGET